MDSSNLLLDSKFALVLKKFGHTKGFNKLTLPLEPQLCGFALFSPVQTPSEHSQYKTSFPHLTKSQQEVAHDLRKCHRNHSHC